MDEIENISEIWNVLKTYIPEKERQIAADHLIPLIVDMDFPDHEFQKFIKSDSFLESAASEYLDEEEEYDEEDWG